MLVLATHIIAPSSVLLLLLVLLAVAILHTVFLQLLKLICVGRADKLALHVKDLTLWVHQEFTVITLNLDATHDHVVLHVNTDLLVGSLATVDISLARLAIETTVTVFHEAIVVEGSLRVIVVVVIALACQTVRLVLHMKRCGRLAIISVSHWRLLVHLVIILKACIISVLQVATSGCASTSSPKIIIHRVLIISIWCLLCNILIVIAVLNNLITHRRSVAINGHPIIVSPPWISNRAVLLSHGSSRCLVPMDIWWW